MGVGEMQGSAWNVATLNGFQKIIEIELCFECNQWERVWCSLHSIESKLLIFFKFCWGSALMRVNLDKISTRLSIFFRLFRAVKLFLSWKKLRQSWLRILCNKTNESWYEQFTLWTFNRLKMRKILLCKKFILKLSLPSTEESSHKDGVRGEPNNYFTKSHAEKFA